VAATAEAAERFRQIASGGDGRTVPERPHQLPERSEHTLIPFAQEGRQDVLADLIAPQVVAAIAAGQLGGIQVHPVGLVAADHAIAAGRDPLGTQVEPAFKAGEIEHAYGVEIDEWRLNSRAVSHPQI
jgi:hypothetical protein